MKTKTKTAAALLAATMALTQSGLSEAYMVTGPNGRSFDVTQRADGGLEILDYNGGGSTTVIPSATGYYVITPRGDSYIQMGPNDKEDGLNVTPEGNGDYLVTPHLLGE